LNTLHFDAFAPCCCCALQLDAATTAGLLDAILAAMLVGERPQYWPADARSLRELISGAPLEPDAAHAPRRRARRAPPALDGGDAELEAELGLARLASAEAALVAERRRCRELSVALAASVALRADADAAAASQLAGCTRALRNARAALALLLALLIAAVFW
jgi:hypothetical protein